MATAVQVEALWNGLTDNSGDPLGAGKVYTYAAGTTTPVSLFTASDKSSSATNPIILDGYGRAQVWADGRYKFVVKTSADVTLYTLDNLLYGFDDSQLLWGGLSTGSANAQAVSTIATTTAYSNGLRLSFIAGYTNTGATTVKINSLTTVNLVKGPSASSLQAGDIVAGQLVNCTYYGGSFRLEDYPTLGDLSQSRTSYATAVAGTNTITGTLAPAPYQYEAGMRVVLKAAATNTGAATLNLNGLGAKTIQRYGAALAGGEILINDMVDLVYDGTQFQLVNATPNPLLLNRTTSQGLFSDGNAGAPVVSFSGDPDTGMFRPTTNSLAFSTAGAERVRIDGSGRIGVGTTAPAFPLDVQGVADSSSKLASTRFSNDSTPVTLSLSKSRGTSVGSNVIVSDGDGVGQITFEAANGTGYNILASILAAVDGAPGASSDMPGRLIFRTAADGTATLSERMRITNAGNVGIGETNPTSRLQLGTDSAAKPTTNTWTITSDERIKTNVAPYAKGLAEILQVRPITYDYNGKGGFQAGPGSVSVIAQELQPVFPECVGSYLTKLNEDDEGLTELLNYNGHAITFALINAIKELNAKVESLEAQLATQVVS